MFRYEVMYRYILAFEVFNEIYDSIKNGRPWSTQGVLLSLQKYIFVQLTLFAIKQCVINVLYLFPIGNMFKTATTSDFGISKERGIIRL